MTQPTTTSALADRLVTDVASHLEDCVSRYMPEWHVPRLFAGHFVGSDVAADLAFTLGFLHDAGVERIADTPIPEAISRVLRHIDGPGTHTFFSYRVAETLAPFGRFAGNRIMEGWSAEEVANLAAACDSTDWLELLDGGHLPQNYAAVLARCEAARLRLGIEVDASVLDRLVAQVRDMLGRNPRGFLDDSQSRIGRYDIYTADVYLFTQPLASILGEVWERGARSALELVAKVAATDGSAITWGRSTGALATCLTIELAAMAVTRGMVDDPETWLTRGAVAADRFGSWMTDGLVNAHQYRSTYGYRGPQRRLQMTLDCLGKLAEAALLLRRTGATAHVAVPPADAWPDRDELVVLDAERNAAVWSYRSGELAFVLPFVGGTISDYLPAPRNPGNFEVPVDAALPTGVPFLWSGLGHYTAGGLPTSITKRDEALHAEYSGFPVVNEMELGERSEPLAGTRSVSYRVQGRTIHVEERLRFDEPPAAIGLQIAETSTRRLLTTFEADRPFTVTTVDTSGLKEYRSFWSELPSVHQLDVEPAREMTIRWSATPMLNVGTSHRDQHYMKAIYDPIADRANITQFPTELVAQDDAVVPHLRALDTFHQHWPEWLTVPDPDVHRSFTRRLRDEDVRVIWTQHNLEPHNKADFTDIYRSWAAAADGVVHHSHWGMQESVERYEFRRDAEHRVIPHVHWGHDVADDLAEIDRDAVERELGLVPCELRLGVLGAPRAEKDVQTVIDAVHLCRRADIGLLVASLSDETVPDDPRICAWHYEFTSRRRYNEMLAVTDVVVLPFTPRGMLTTGVVGDVVGAGKPAIVSPWPYLDEALGDAGIAYDGTVDSLVAVIDALDSASIERATTASRALQAPYAREVVATAHLVLMEDLGVGFTRR